MKVGSGLDITDDGVLSAGGGALVVPVTLERSNHTATINQDSTITKRQVWQALTTGRPVVGLEKTPFGSVEKSLCCCGASFGDADGGVATFFYIDNDGKMEYFFLPSLLM